MLVKLFYAIPKIRLFEYHSRWSEHLRIKRAKITSKGNNFPIEKTVEPQQLLLRGTSDTPLASVVSFPELSLALWSCPLASLGYISLGHYYFSIRSD